MLSCLSIARRWPKPWGRVLDIYGVAREKWSSERSLPQSQLRGHQSLKFAKLAHRDPNLTKCVFVQTRQCSRARWYSRGLEPNSWQNAIENCLADENPVCRADLVDLRPRVLFQQMLGELSAACCECIDTGFRLSASRNAYSIQRRETPTCDANSCTPIGSSICRFK